MPKHLGYLTIAPEDYSLKSMDLIDFDPYLDPVPVCFEIQAQGYYIAFDVAVLSNELTNYGNWVSKHLRHLFHSRHLGFPALHCLARELVCKLCWGPHETHP